MNDPAPRPARQSATPKPTRRALAKQRTTDNILAQGRRLFDELGYDAATLRDVARAANVSTGAVFGNFVNKAALFVGVINADCEALAQRMDDARVAQDDAVEAVLRLLAVAQEHHAGSVGLIRSAISFAWRRDVGMELSELTGPDLIRDRLAAALRQGVETGEICLPADARIVAQQLLSGYLAAYAPTTHVPAKDLRALQIAQARGLLKGYAINCNSRSQAA